MFKHDTRVYQLFTVCSWFNACLQAVSTCFSHRADLLPLSVQFCLLIGLFEAPSLSAFRHLDAVLEGSPAGTNFIINPLYSTLWYAQSHFFF